MKSPMVIYIRRRQSQLLIFMAGIAIFYCLIMVNLIYFPLNVVLKHEPLQDFATSMNTSNARLQFHGRFNKEYIFNSSPGRNDASTSKLILLWSPLFDGWNFLEVGKDSFRESNCSESRCEITTDRNRLRESDAVLFHVRTMSLTDIPRNRTPHQKWIFFSLEAPPYSHFQGFVFMSGMFNWTMTYRSDSDVVIHYGRIKRNDLKIVDESSLYKKWRSKTKMGVWMVSHCSTAGNREGYIKEMENYMDVTTYGECGMAVCIFNKTNQCLENFSKRFFFYLAFENAICSEYVTEKFYRILNYDIIPVVFGGGNYTSIAPANSYINALDFPSPMELSSHLHRVAMNYSLYASYFKWKLKGYSIEDVPNHCGLCEKLHSTSFFAKTVHKNLNEWWVRKAHCQRWK